MGITLEEYKAIIGGRTTLEKIEQSHKANNLPKTTDLPTPLPSTYTTQGRQPMPYDIPHGAVGWLGELPYPPTVNTYYRHVGAKVLISSKGRKYREAVCRQLRGVAPVTGEVLMRVDVFPPDCRRRDLDNLLKGLQDSITHAGLLVDDADIKRLVMVMHEPCRPDGKVQVGLSRISG